MNGLLSSVFKKLLSVTIHSMNAIASVVKIGQVILAISNHNADYIVTFVSHKS